MRKYPIYSVEIRKVYGHETLGHAMEQDVDDYLAAKTVCMQASLCYCTAESLEESQALQRCFFVQSPSSPASATGSHDEGEVAGHRNS